MARKPKSLPSGLPQINTRYREEKSALSSARICKGCGEEGRVVSNSTGTAVHCNTCKTFWPISSTPNVATVAPTMARGTSKVVMVEPDWNKAFESDEGDVTNEQVGPKQRE